MRRRSAAASVCLSLFCLTPAATTAQGVRITGTTTAQYVELRPWVDDSIPVDSTSGTDVLRTSTRGVVVHCDSGQAYCRYRRSATSAVSALPLIQDLQLSGWGLGQGIQVYAHGRARAAVGEARDVWPRAGDPFDLLAAYVEIDRDLFRARAGRQYATTGFGFYNFDGATLGLSPRSDLDVEVYGGWSLERGLNEPATSSEIAAVEEIPPDSRGILFGVDARYRPTTALSLGAAYQREGRADRGGLYADRAAADGELRLGRWGSVTGDFELDLATMYVNEAWLRAQIPVRDRISVQADVRRYRPFFELWTIWGVFSPVGYTEGTAGAAWTSADALLSVDARAGWRRYDDTGTGLEFAPLRNDGWELSLDGTWRIRHAFLASAGWRTQIGYGAARTDFDAGFRWEPAARGVFLGARATAFQDVYEFRVGTGRVIGLGVDAGATLRYDVRLVADAALYHHTYGDMAPSTNWSQARVNLRLEWTLGGDPGLPHVAPGGVR
jgi:hypothetical protein